MPEIIEITDFLAPELDIYARFTEVQLLNRHEPEKGIFIAESPKVIERALNAGCVPISFLVEQRQVESQEQERLFAAGTYRCTRHRFMCDTAYRLCLTRGMLCAMRRPKQPSVGEICAGARRIAVLENVVNPTNVGAIFPFCGGFECGWCFVDTGVQRSFVPPGDPGEYGDCLSDTMDFFGQAVFLAFAGNCASA